MLTTLFYHVLPLFLITDIYFLIAAVIAQIFIPNAKLSKPVGTATNKAANAEIEAQPLTAEIT